MSAHSNASSGASRYDFYGPSHKGLRRAMCSLMERLGSGNFGDEAQRHTLLGELRALLEVFEQHAQQENTFVHPAVEERAKGATATLAREHEAHFQEIAALRKLADTLAGQPDPAAAHALYLAFSRFVAENLTHMAQEEQVLQGKIHAHFSDQEIIALEGRLIASVSPPLMMTLMKMMIPAMNRDERAFMLGGMKQAAPPEAFNAVMQGAARPHLAEADWQDLTRRLGVSA